MNDNSLFGSPWDDIIEDCCADIRGAEDDEGSNENEESESRAFIILRGFLTSSLSIFQKIFANESIIFVRRFVCPPTTHMCVAVRMAMNYSKTV